MGQHRAAGPVAVAGSGSGPPRRVASVTRGVITPDRRRGRTMIAYRSPIGRARLLRYAPLLFLSFRIFLVFISGLSRKKIVRRVEVHLSIRLSYGTLSRPHLSILIPSLLSLSLSRCCSPLAISGDGRGVPGGRKLVFGWGAERNGAVPFFIWFAGEGTEPFQQANIRLICGTSSLRKKDRTSWFSKTVGSPTAVDFDS